jgi:hypothetical protein
MILVTRSFQITPEQDAELNRLSKGTSRSAVIRRLIDDRPKPEVHNLVPAPLAPDIFSFPITPGEHDPVVRQLWKGVDKSNKAGLPVSLDAEVVPIEASPVGQTQTLATAPSAAPLAETLDAVVANGAAVTAAVENVNKTCDALATAAIPVLPVDEPVQETPTPDPVWGKFKRPGS